MKVNELRDKLKDMPDDADIEIAIISKSGLRRVLRQIANCELKYGFPKGRSVWISCYKSLRDEMDKLGGMEVRGHIKSYQ